jgi:4-hydroxy-2-oxoheptanedioate aldolase
MTLPSVRAIAREKGLVLNGYVTMPSAASAEFYAQQGWDCVTLDMEHGAIGIDVAVEITRAIRASGVVPMVRIPRGDPAWVSVLLDAGILGVTAAMVSTADDAGRLVEASLYPPAGKRGVSRQSRAAVIYGPDYLAAANDSLSLFAMIETVEGLRNLEAITSVAGITGIYFGGVDYASSLRESEETRDWNEEGVACAVRDARKSIGKVCAAKGLLAGMYASSAAEAAILRNEGYRFMTLASDAVAMMSYARRLVDDVRRLGTERA